MYPIEKYRYYNAGNKIIAVSTYAGKTVRGVAICDPEDTFSLEKGKELAAARCAMKIATKRFGRATKKLSEAEEKVYQAQDFADKMLDYYDDAWAEVCEVQDHLNEVLLDM